MLYENTVAPDTLGLLRTLMSVEALKPFALVGGTNLQPVETVEGIRMASVPDIVAMKLNAITRRSTKKDFFDIFELLDYFSLKEMLDFFATKYTTTDIGFVVRSLTYFDGAENSKDPILIKQVNWDQVKQKIQQAVQDFWRQQSRLT